MTVLITYPQERLDSAQRTRLEQAETHGSVVYCPLRALRGIDLDADAQQTIAASDPVIVTSPFALDVYAHRLRRLNPQATLIVLSRAMAAQAQRDGIVRTLVPDEENQRGVARLLASMPPSDTARAAVLCGDLRVPHDRIPQEIPRVRIYENAWDAEHEDAAVAAIARSADEAHPIDRVLATSPSAYRRLQAIVARLPQRFAVRPRYYTLGPSTAAAIRGDGFDAVEAHGPGVLRDAVERIIADLG